MQVVIKFGKYRGYPLVRLTEDPDYVSWLMAQDWLEDRHPEVWAYIHGLAIPSLEYCSALTRKGEPCQFWAKFNGKCLRHLNRDSEPDFTAWESELISA